jgi:pantothenate kinase
MQAIQQNRNGLFGVAFLGAIVSLLAQEVFSIMIDAEKRDLMKALAVRHCRSGQQATGPPQIHKH